MSPFSRKKCTVEKEKNVETFFIELIVEKPQENDFCSYNTFAN